MSYAPLAAKLVLTVPVAALLTQPLWAPHWGAGILGEIHALGAAGAAVAVLAFLALVAAYCRCLQRLLAAIPPAARTASPRSVWWMFAIPYNFVEDFFIVAAIAASLRNDGRVPPARRRLWRRLGLAWCALQIVSLLPGALGVAAGAAALPAWAAHWILSVRLLRLLGDTAPNTPRATASA
ncbi:hypothetical protein A7A76_09870 [Lysobacter enzymogenes]|uniref:hypothetical protein n=1 Tax=Lysobacter enzymogenes TaxID=69 RepID=UPI0019D16DD1|nr:hypothetical protein [Lysobacter enzymogenes]MBN7135061.1 hypothetical protein [Lysobacter enzymogenes]